MVLDAQFSMEYKATLAIISDLIDREGIEVGYPDDLSRTNPLKLQDSFGVGHYCISIYL